MNKNNKGPKSRRRRINMADVAMGWVDPITGRMTPAGKLAAKKWREENRKAREERFRCHQEGETRD